MNSINPSALEAYRRAFAVRGIPVLIRRVSGDAPAVTTVDAAIAAVIESYGRTESTVASIKPEGSITQARTHFIVLAPDLAAKGFPLPLAKNDKIFMPVMQPDGSYVAPLGLPTEEVLNIIDLDPHKRAIAGAIELVAEGA